jgi:hypothetical protein
VTVAIPADAEPGGRYGSVLFSTRSSSPPGLGAQTVSRLAALFFVRVTGHATEQGALERFALREQWLSLDQKPLTFPLLFRNTGNVHLDPFGKITITNMYGGNVGELEVAAFYALPGSLRSREVIWKHPPLFGRYTAILALHRGYSDIVDEQTVTFWVVPWKMIVAVIGALVAVVLVSRILAGLFEIRRRT